MNYLSKITLFFYFKEVLSRLLERKPASNLLFRLKSKLDIKNKTVCIMFSLKTRNYFLLFVKI